MIYILGADGFVGSAFIRYCERNKWPYKGITRSNYNDLKGSHCDLFINANGNSKKFLAQQDPVSEFEMSTLSVYKSLYDFKFNKYVYLSSSDVYPDCSNPLTTQESSPIDEKLQSPYGFHKYLAEKIVKKQAPQWLIFRLSGMVGENMRKNPIYDILQGGPLWVSPESEFQFMNTDDVAQMVLMNSTKVQNEIYNLGGWGTIKIQDVLNIVGHNVSIKQDAKKIVHNMSVEKIYSIYPKIESNKAIKQFLEEVFIQNAPKEPSYVNNKSP